MKVKLLLIASAFYLAYCKSPNNKLMQQASNAQFLTDKNLLELNMGLPISNDSLENFLNSLGIDIPILRIDTGLIKHAYYDIPTVLVYKGGKSLKEKICNANFPGLLNHIENSLTDSGNWIEPPLPQSELRRKIIGLSNEKKTAEVNIFYFYTIFFDNLIKNQMKLLFNEAKAHNDFNVYFINMDNYSDLGLTDSQYNALIQRHNPYTQPN